MRASLLLALSLVACGGKARLDSQADGAVPGQAGAPAQGGSDAAGGAPAQAGSPSSSQAGASSAGGARPTATCEDAHFNPVSKLEECGRFLSHRAQALPCTYNDPHPAPGATGGAGNVDIECSLDRDCDSLLYGFCERRQDPWVCRTGCAQDSDCGTDLCNCDGFSPGRCFSAGCHVDADCEPNALCVPTVSACGGASFECTHPLVDECTTFADCGLTSGLSCMVVDGVRRCVASGTACN